MISCRCGDSILVSLGQQVKHTTGVGFQPVNYWYMRRICFALEWTLVNVTQLGRSVGLKVEVK